MGRTRQRMEKGKGTRKNGKERVGLEEARKGREGRSAYLTATTLNCNYLRLLDS